MEPTNVDTQTYVIAVESDALERHELHHAPRPIPPTVVASLKSLPALFIAMRPSDFATVRDSGTGGIGESGGNEQYERPCSAELVLPAEPAVRRDSTASRSTPACARTWVTTKRAFRLYFKREYGAGKLNYPVFESAPWDGESAVEEFDKLVLRHHSNDGWEGRWGGADEALVPARPVRARLPDRHGRPRHAQHLGTPVRQRRLLRTLQPERAAGRRLPRLLPRRGATTTTSASITAG